MKLLDKIARKLGYIPADSMLVKPMVMKEVLPVQTFAAYIDIPKYDLECMKEDKEYNFDMDRWAKRKLVEKCTDEIISCMKIGEEIDKDGSIIYSCRIRIIDMNVEED